MPVINLTPHVVRIVDGSAPPIEVPPSGMVARVSVSLTPVGTIDGIPIVRSVAGPVVGLPSPTDGVACIVSRVVAEAARDRSDLLVPADLVRDAEGRVIGCRALERLGP